MQKNGGVSMTLFVHASPSYDGKASGKRRESVGKTSREILHNCMENPEITIPELALKIGVTERSIERNIQKLQQEGFLRRSCGRKEGRWDVILN